MRRTRLGQGSPCATGAASVVVTVGESFSGIFHHQELSHHTGVFMFHDVAVVHVWGLGIGVSVEGHDDADGIAGGHQDRVFPAELGARGRLAVTIEYLELDQVDVERMRLAAGIAHFPRSRCLPNARPRRLSPCPLTCR